MPGLWREGILPKGRPLQVRPRVRCRGSRGKLHDEMRWLCGTNIGILCTVHLKLCFLPQIPQLPVSGPLIININHGLINYIDTKAKCHLKNWPVKGFCGRCLSEFIDWRYSKSCLYFIFPALRNSPVQGFFHNPQDWRRCGTSLS
jgi:hypothetical protein